MSVTPLDFFGPVLPVDAGQSRRLLILAVPPGADLAPEALIARPRANADLRGWVLSGAAWDEILPRGRTFTADVLAGLLAPVLMVDQTTPEGRRTDPDAYEAWTLMPRDGTELHFLGPPVTENPVETGQAAAGILDAVAQGRAPVSPHDHLLVLSEGHLIDPCMGLSAPLHALWRRPDATVFWRNRAADSPIEPIAIPLAIACALRAGAQRRADMLESLAFLVTDTLGYGFDTATRARHARAFLGVADHTLRQRRLYGSHAALFGPDLLDLADALVRHTPLAEETATYLACAGRGVSQHVRLDQEAALAAARAEIARLPGLLGLPAPQTAPLPA